ncbi:MAG: hypothetical protein AAFU66_09160 [Pseudomonadota bacterium]
MHTVNRPHSPVALHVLGIAGVVIVLFGACSDDDSGSGQVGDDVGRFGTEVDAPSPTTPVAGDGADPGWLSAFDKDGVVSRCDVSEAELADAPSVTIDNRTLYVAFEQIGVNQNPLLIRYDDGSQVYCVRHEAEGPDGRALGLTWDGGAHAYVMYSIVGGASSLEGKPGWLSSYAPGAISGGGPKVSVLGRVQVADGALTEATFVIAVTSAKKVNSHRSTAAPVRLADGSVEFRGESAYRPIAVDGKAAMDCDESPFVTQYRLSPDLGTLMCASSTHCRSERPCSE